MKRQVVFLSVAMISTATAGVASAYDFSDKVYGKAVAGLSYHLEHIQGDVLEENNLEREWSGANDYLHNLGLRVGYNVYYKATSLLHPFVGVEFAGRIPLKVKTRDVTNQYNHASFDFKAGLKLNNFVKNVSLQPYGVFGVAILERKNKLADEYNRYIDEHNASVLDPDDKLGYLKKHEVVPALNYGVGIEAIYDVCHKLALVGGFEYKRVEATKKTSSTDFKLKTDQFSFKFGVQFL